jgi:hypothetical protein
MTRILFALSICLATLCQAQSTTAQEGPNDPLLQLTDKVVMACLEKENGIAPFILPDEPKREKDSERVAAIKKFGAGFWFITEQKVKQASSPWSTIMMSDFKMRRPSKDGKPIDEVILRLEAPVGVTLTDTRDGQRYRFVQWTIHFVKRDSSYLIESVKQEFTNDPGQQAGVQLTL